jgi:hypothetical protein
MELILFSGDDCSQCHEAEEAFKKKYKKELATGEAVIYNLDDGENAAAQRFWMTHDLPLAPVIAVVTEDEKLIAILDPEKDLDIKLPAAPPAAEGVKVAVESSS